MATLILTDNWSDLEFQLLTEGKESKSSLRSLS